MAEITANGSNLGNALQQFLMCDELVAGDEPSYQMCKTIYLYHPLGGKMAESPIKLAQSQAREISIPNSPEEKIREAFLREWDALGVDNIILNVMTQSRVYGVASVALLAEGVPSDRPIDPKRLPDLSLSFNVLDPLNTAGSLVLNQNPNALDFQKSAGISISGLPYHRSRTVTVMHEKPIYIAYSPSAFGYVGRSVYQRALFPLKTFIQSLVTDDMVMKKGGVLVAMMEQAGSITDAVMSFMAGRKRNLLKEARTDNVLSIGLKDKIETLNMQNMEGPIGQARKNVLENIAMAADMPAKVINQETFAEGFGEGTEDAKAVARYIDHIRNEMKPLYDFFDNIVKYRAWNPEYYKTIQAQFPEEYGNKAYTTAFYEWTNSFSAEWPNLLTEPDSEKIKVEEVKLKAVISVAEVLIPNVDPANKVAVYEWIADNFNEDKMLFKNPLTLDLDTLEEFLSTQQELQNEALKNGGNQPGEEEVDPDGELHPPHQPRAFGDSQSLRRLPKLLLRK